MARVAKDFTVDGLNSNTTIKIPVYESISNLNTKQVPGSILFNSGTNLFYGKTNNSFVPINGRNIGTFNTGVNPAGMDITPDNKFAYVANNNNYAIPGQDSVSILNLTTNLPQTTIFDPSFIEPYTVTINSTETKAYITNSGGFTVSVINIATNLVESIITGFDGPSGLVISKSGTTAYVNNYGATSGIFTGSINGNILTVTSVAQGIISVGMPITSNGVFVGSISGGVLTVTSIISGVIGVGSTITGSGVTPTTITSLGTGIGGTGTYNILLPQAVPSTTITSTQAPGFTLTSGTTIIGYGTAFGGGVGTYIVNLPQTVGSTTIGAVTPGVGSGNGNTVSVVNLNTNTITSSIAVGLAPAALAITPDGNFVFSANYVDGNPNTATLSKIQTSNNTVIATIGPFSPNGFSGPFAIKITPDGEKAYVTNFGSNNFFPFGTTISVVDLNLNIIIKTITLGIQPSGLAINKEGTKGLVSNYNTLYSNISQFTGLTAGQGTVNIIDLLTDTVIEPIISVGQSPSYIVITPNDSKALVSNYTSNTVNVLSL